MNRNGPTLAHGRARRVKTPAAAGGDRLAPALGVRLGPRRGAAAEAAIVEHLLTQGWAPEVKRGERDAAEAEARATLDRLVERGLRFQRSASGERRFDPAEVTNFATWLSLEHGDGFWSERCVPAGRRFTWAAHGLAPRKGACAPPPLALGPRRFKVRFNRLFNLQGFAPGAPTRLRLPLPIEDAALRDLAIEILPAPGLEVEYAVGEARLDARLKVPASQSVELGFEASFTAWPSGGEPAPAPLDAETLALYTRPREGLIAVSKTIRSLAADLAGDERDPWAQVERFWDFLFDRLTHGVVNYDEVDPARPNDWTLENGWADCQQAAALMTALCRARNIPARLISGYVMNDDTPCHHYWAEAWIAERGWLPLDLNMSWNFANGGREPAWRNYYRGRLDYRMKTERLPRLFNGTGSVRVPAACHRLTKLLDEGMELAFHASETGDLIYREQVAIVGGDGPPAQATS
jgi:hypothetical protein